MKTRILSLILIAVLGAAPVAFTACSTPPDARTQAYQTLRVVGTTAKQSMDAATQLLKQGSITVAQWQKVADFYDKTWQPAFSIAVTAAQSDLKPTSPEIANLALQFLALVAQLYPTHPNTP